MIKKLSLNYIKDVLGKNLTKPQKKEEILENQKIVASSLSNKNQNLEKNNEFNNSPFEKNQTSIDNSNLQITRGWFDFKAINIRFTNEKKFKKFLPKTNEQQKLYKLFIYSRSIYLGFCEYKGCKINVRKYFDQLSLLFGFELEKEQVVLFNSLIDFFELKKNNKTLLNKYYPKLSKSDFENIFKKIANQEQFSKECLKIINKLISIKNKEDFNSPNENDEINNKNEKIKEQKKQQQKSKLFSDISKKEGEKEKKKIDRSIVDEDVSENLKKRTYNQFTKEFDLSVNAEKLAKKDELQELRRKFEKEYSENHNLINKLARKLDRLFNSLNKNLWVYDQEEGHFDSSKFANFIANPDYQDIFKYEKQIREKNTVVSLLLDNSGSMRGKPIITSAITTEIITKVLEKCNVNVEILGFTTREWKGGNSKKKWENLGKPSFPGRLNDLLHIIYKDADCRWSNCKKNLGLVLKDGLLKENIDGEALIWAYSRLNLRREKKKILVVISDGAPVDDSTLSTNTPDILDNHLKDIVDQIQKKNKVQLLAIGIGHDVSKYYNNAFVIEDVDSLGDIIIENLSKLLS